MPMRLGSTVIQGTRAGGARRESLPLAVTVDRVVALYHCANHHQTAVPFISTAKVPGQWVVYQLRPAHQERPTESPAAE